MRLRGVVRRAPVDAGRVLVLPGCVVRMIAGRWPLIVTVRDQGRPDRVGRSREEPGEMARDGRIAFVRQTKLPKSRAAITRRGYLARRGHRQEVFQNALHVVAREIDGDRCADHRASRSEHRDRDVRRRRLAEHPFFRAAAQSPQRRSLRDGEPHIGTRLAHAALDEGRERQVDVVAAEQQMVADRDPLERGHARVNAHANQTEVGRAATDVAHQRNTIGVHANICQLGPTRLPRPTRPTWPTRPT